jgi:transposase
MIGLASGVRIWLVAGITDMRKGMDSLSAHVQTALSENPFDGQLFIFRGRRADRLKILWHQAQGLCLYYRRLDEGHFVWPQPSSGTVLLSAAQLSLLLEGIDWRRAHRSAGVEADPIPPTVAT